MSSGDANELVIDGPLLGSWPKVRSTRVDGAEVALTVVDHAGHLWTATGPPDSVGVAPSLATAHVPLWARLRGPTGATFSVANTHPVEVEMSLNGHPASLVARVPVTSNQVVIETVMTDAFRGLLVRPSLAGPGVVLLGGSEGGVGGPLPVALALADEGWWCLIVGYVGVKGTPSALSEVPLEPIVAGIGWLAGHDDVVGERVAVWGASKGAEAALVAASLTELVSGVVSVSGSPVVFEGLDPTHRRSSWTFGGTALPFTRLKRVRSIVVFGRRHDEVSLRPIYGRGPRAAGRKGASTSHLERLQVPVLMICGVDDRFWPADPMAERAKRRSSRIRTLSLDGTGHLITVPGLPPVSGVGSSPMLRTGGSLEIAPRSVSVAWDATKHFLSDTHSTSEHSRR
jgi:dienelactone hydrolase